MIKHSSQRSLLETDALARITLLKDERTQVVQQIKGARTSLQLALRTKLKQAITTPDSPVLAPLSVALRPFQGTYDSSLVSIRDRLLKDRSEAIDALDELSPHSERSFDDIRQAYYKELNDMREQSATTHERLYQLEAKREDKALEDTLTDLGIRKYDDIERFREERDAVLNQQAPKKPSWWQLWGADRNAWNIYEDKVLHLNNKNDQLNVIETAAIDLFSRRMLKVRFRQDLQTQNERTVNLTEKLDLLSRHQSALQITDTDICDKLCATAEHTLSFGFITHIQASLDAVHKACPTLITPEIALLATKEEKLTELLKSIDHETEQAKRFQAYGEGVRRTPQLAQMPRFKEAVRLNQAANRRATTIVQTRQKIEAFDCDCDDVLGAELLRWAAQKLIQYVLSDDDRHAPTNVFQGHGGTMAGAGASGSWNEDKPSNSVRRMDMAIALGLPDIDTLNQFGVQVSAEERQAFQTIREEPPIAIAEAAPRSSYRTADDMERSARTSDDDVSRRHSSGYVERDFRSFATRNDEANYTPAASAPASVAAPPSISPPSIPSGGWGD